MTISSSDLDFANIKNKLKTFLKQQNEFADYDFEASGLSNILDVLAYNTHINGLIANMAINESFLSSAQLRSSVLAHAEALGYTPKSATAATAVVNVSVEIPNGPDTLTLNTFTDFYTDVEQVNYGFKTMQSYIAINDNGKYVFKDYYGNPNITLKEGTVKTKTFPVGDDSDNQVFVLSDKNIDTSTINVLVYEDFNTQDFTVYTNIDKAVSINEESTVYLIRESANGSYEIQFSDGNTLGKRPLAGNKIVVRYLTTVGEEANGGKSFITQNISYENSTYPVVVKTVSFSAGGSGKESIDSIKLNAPRAYTAQQRLVTANDYEALILRHFSPYLDGVIAWGGNENVPPQYGKVFVSLQFKEGIDQQTQDLQKQIMKDQLINNLSIMSIGVEFVEPQLTYLQLAVNYNLDQSKTTSSLAAINNLIYQFIKSYFNNNLNKFASTFRRSQLLAQIDNLSAAVLNSQMTVWAQQRVEAVSVGMNKDYTLKYPFILASPDKDEHTVSTSVFVYKGQNVYIKNALGTNRLQVFDLNNNVKLYNAGSYDPAKGIVNIVGINVESDTLLKVSAKPANQSTLAPLRNYVLTLDETFLDVTGVVETDDSKAVL